MSESRRARLAALRQNRGKNPTEVCETPQELQETQDEIPFDPSRPPTLTLGNRTVEALSAEIQAEVLEKSNREATSLFEEKPKKSTAHLTQDLKQDISGYLELAKSKTDAAIMRIIQERYEKD